jgi:hypothetical protein
MTRPAHPDADPLAFTPVPTAPRRDGWTPERQRAFIAALAGHGGVAAAARSVGMTPQGARKLRLRPQGESFARAWDAAVEEGRMKAADKALALARAGEFIPLFRNGRQIGVRKRLDNRLLFAACYGEPMSRYDRID